MTIKGYFVFAKEKDAPGDFVQLNDLPVLPPYANNGLNSNTTYQFYVRTIDDAGWLSDASDVFEFTTPEHQPGDQLSPEDQAVVDQIVLDSMAESKQPGILLALSGPRGDYIKAYGNTAGSGVRPLTIDDHSRIASTTKSFTSTAVMKAIGDGLLSLDSTLDQYVSGVPNGNLITIKHMLQMRSGIYDYTTHPLVLLSLTLFPTASWNAATILSYIRSGAPYFTPGTGYQYNNGNYVLLGLVLEAVTGRKIRNILVEDLIQPLGLTETDWQVNASGNGVSTVTAPAANTQAWNPDMLGPAGGLTSTVGDLLKWAQAMRDHTFVDEEIWDYWTNPTGDAFYGYAAPFPEGTPALFGYGLGLESTGTWLGHNGSWFGCGCQTAFDKDSGACIAVLENLQTTTGNGPVPLAAYTTIFRKVAGYLYPDSMNQPAYVLPPEA